MNYGKRKMEFKIGQKVIHIYCIENKPYYAMQSVIKEIDENFYILENGFVVPKKELGVYRFLALVEEEYFGEIARYQGQ
jgi:hypothetical protein